MDNQPEKTTLSEKETDALFSNVQQANRLLRSRAVILAIIFIIGFGFLRLKNVSDSSQDTRRMVEYDLEQLVKAPDMKAYMDDGHYFYYEGLNNFGYDIPGMVYDIQKGHYQDRAPAFKMLAKVREDMENLRVNSKEPTISLLGMNMPVTPWYWIAPIVILILFHDFAQIMFYRNRILRMLESAGIEDWRQGPEIFGVWQNKTASVSAWFIRSIGSVVTMVFLLLPLFSSVLFLVFTNRLLEHGSSGAYLILIINALCPVLILADISILVFDGNILRLRSLLHWTAGNWQDKTVTIARIGRWVLLPALVLLLHFFYFFHYRSMSSSPDNNFPIVWKEWVLLMLPMVLLIAGYWVRIKVKPHLFGDVLLFAGGTLVVYWFVAFLAMVIVNLYFNAIWLRHLASISIYIIPIALATGLGYGFVKQWLMKRVTRQIQ